MKFTDKVYQVAAWCAFVPVSPNSYSRGKFRIQPVGLPSQVLDNLLSPHQRLMLNTTYANHAEMRKKYVCICASAISPLLPAASYLDKEARENELKQVRLQQELHIVILMVFNTVSGIVIPLSPFPYDAIMPIQVIGDTISAHDLDADERLIVGKDGLLLISSDLSKHEPILMSHLSLMSRNLFMSSLFQVQRTDWPLFFFALNILLKYDHSSCQIH